MSMKIIVPIAEIIGLKGNSLELAVDQRCSRCDHSPAPFYEIHRLQLMGGPKKKRLYGKKYKVFKDYKLKISLCEECYRSDYLTHPEKLDQNNTRLGRIVRFQSILWSLGGILAAIGFLLMMPLIPENDFFIPLKRLWYIPVVIGVFFIGLNWFLQKQTQKGISLALEKSAYDLKSYSRAEVFSPIVDGVHDLSATALEITMKNESWAAKIAEMHGWTFEKVDAQISGTPSSEK
jgi:hypothetical protein